LGFQVSPSAPKYKENNMIKWLNEPEQHDYPAALSYLTLIFEDNIAKKYIDKLKNSKITFYKAKDIFRAASLPLLSKENYHVKHDLHKIQIEKALSPLLLIRYNGKVIIADGYHRLCAVYILDEDASIPCYII
jgi:hypothetical protein